MTNQPTALERAETWQKEHPSHMHHYTYKYNTKNKHCPCGAYINRMDGHIVLPYEQGGSNETTR